MTARTAISLGPHVTRAASAAALLLLWQFASAASPMLPGPAMVLRTMVEEAVHGPLMWHAGVTLLRVAAAVSLAMLAGGTLGIAMGRHKGFDAAAAPWVKSFLNLPALVIMVLVYLWLGLTDVAAVLAVAIDKVPFIAITLRDGARAADRQHDELARIYRFNAGTRVRHVLLPQLAPYVMIALRNGLAVGWKLMLVAEFLGRPDGIGFVIQSSFQLFDVARLLAYALFFVGVILLCDALLLQPIERRLTSWRQP